MQPSRPLVAGETPARQGKGNQRGLRFLAGCPLEQIVLSGHCAFLLCVGYTWRVFRNRYDCRRKSDPSRVPSGCQRHQTPEVPGFRRLSFCLAFTRESNLDKFGTLLNFKKGGADMAGTAGKSYRENTSLADLFRRFPVDPC